jgi:hypothetical protein
MLSSSSLPLCFLCRRRRVALPATEEGYRPPPAAPPPHAAPPQPPGPTPLRAGALLPLPRRPVELRGRLLAAAVASSVKSPASASLACLSTRRVPAMHSPHSFATSPPQTPRTPPPSARTPASSSSPSLRPSRTPPPTRTPAIALPRSCAAPWPFPFHPRPPEQPRRRSRTPTAAARRRRASSGRLLLDPDPLAGSA